MSISKEYTVNFPEVFNPNTGKGEYVAGVRSINQSIKLILLTNKGELLGDPLFGSNLRQLVFCYNDVTNNDLIRQEIIMSVGTYEKRVKMTSDNIYIENYDNNVKITMSYLITKEGTVGQLELYVLKGGVNIS